MLNLEKAKNLVNQLDEIRIKRSLLSSSDEFAHVFNLIAPLLHYNHPNLPCFTPEAPCGISNFSFKAYQQKYINSKLPNNIINDKNYPCECSIDGVYAMGSTSSITQTSSSDLDIWVCINDNLTDLTLINRLTKKTNDIKNWARNLGVDINFFIIKQNRFKGEDNFELLSSENCGSSQHILLLDEFYRSAIRLAGKPILWLHILTQNEKDYEITISELINDNKIDPNEWVDFGGLGNLSPKEYLGATLWHLFKAIDSPYKAVLKILLIESYSWEYPYTKLVSVQFKQDLLLQHPNSHCFDQYIMMLAHVTNYLKQNHDEKRLQLIHKCFYIKTNADLDKFPDNNWRLLRLKELSKQFNFSPEMINNLNQAKSWNLKQVQEIYTDLENMLLGCYAKMLDFARKHELETSIMPLDQLILGRKLYCAFEKAHNKVNILNLQLANDLSEKNLTFIERNKDSNSLKKGWYLVNTPINKYPSDNSRYTKFHPHLAQLVAWSYFNGLLVEHTKVNVSSKNINQNKLLHFIQDLKDSLHSKTSSPSHEDLYKPCGIKTLFIAINLTGEQQNPKSNEIFDEFNLDINEQNIIHTIDFIYRTTWNEIMIEHFEGKDIIQQSLQFLNSKISNNSQPPSLIKAFCYGENYRFAITKFIYKLINDCLHSDIKNIIYNDADNTEVKPTQWIKNYWQDFFAGQEKEFDNYSFFYKEIENFAIDGFLQFFFENNPDKSYNVFLLNETNKLEVFRNCKGKKADAIKRINMIYADKTDDKNINIIRNNFNFPQFYQIIYTPQLHIVPFFSKEHLAWEQQ